MRCEYICKDNASREKNKMNPFIFVSSIADFHFCSKNTKKNQFISK